MDNRKEVKRENKQVRKLKKLRSLDYKGKTDTNRYKKLKKQVYNPFIDDRKDMKKMGAAMGKVKNPIPKYDPTEGVKKGVNKQGINDFNKRSAAAIKKDNDRKKWKKMYPGGAIKMTAAPHEYFLGGGMGKGGFNLAKGLVGKAVSKAKPILKNAATDLGIDQAL